MYAQPWESSSQHDTCSLVFKDCCGVLVYMHHHSLVWDYFCVGCTESQIMFTEVLVL